VARLRHLGSVARRRDTTMCDQRLFHVAHERVGYHGVKLTIGGIEASCITGAKLDPTA
jgi:hypothetical protein